MSNEGFVRQGVGLNSRRKNLKQWKGFQYDPCPMCNISLANSKYSFTERPLNIFII